MSFQNIDEIDDHFKREMAASEDDQSQAVQFAWDRAKFEFERNAFQAERQAAARASAIEEAVKKHPNLKGMEDYIRGDTAKEIKDSAQRLSDKVGGPKPDAAKEAYGPSTGVVGQPVRVEFDDARDRVHRIKREIDQGRRLKEDDAKFFVAAVGGNAMGNIRRALRHGAAGRN